MDRPSEKLPSPYITDVSTDDAMQQPERFSSCNDPVHYDKFESLLQWDEELRLELETLEDDCEQLVNSDSLDIAEDPLMPQGSTDAFSKASEISVVKDFLTPADATRYSQNALPGESGDEVFKDDLLKTSHFSPLMESSPDGSAFCGSGRSPASDSSYAVRVSCSSTVSVSGSFVSRDDVCVGGVEGELAEVMKDQQKSEEPPIEAEHHQLGTKTGPRETETFTLETGRIHSEQKEEPVEPEASRPETRHRQLEVSLPQTHRQLEVSLPQTRHRQLEANGMTETGIVKADHIFSNVDHTQRDRDHTQPEAHYTQSEADGHAQSDTDHTQTDRDHTQPEADYNQSEADGHAQSDTDHTQTDTDHTSLEAEEWFKEVTGQRISSVDLDDDPIKLTDARTVNSADRPPALLLAGGSADSAGPGASPGGGASGKDKVGDAESGAEGRRRVLQEALNDTASGSDTVDVSTKSWSFLRGAGIRQESRTSYESNSAMFDSTDTDDSVFLSNEETEKCLSLEASEDPVFSDVDELHTPESNAGIEAQNVRRSLPRSRSRVLMSHCLASLPCEEARKVLDYQYRMAAELNLLRNGFRLRSRHSSDSQSGDASSHSGQAADAELPALGRLTADSLFLEVADDFLREHAFVRSSPTNSSSSGSMTTHPNCSVAHASEFVSMTTRAGYSSFGRCSFTGSSSSGSVAESSSLRPRTEPPS